MSKLGYIYYTILHISLCDKIEKLLDIYTMVTLCNNIHTCKTLSIFKLNPYSFVIKWEIFKKDFAYIIVP